MPRRAKKPWYWRDGYYVVIGGKRLLLARGPRSDELFDEAFEKLLPLIEVPKLVVCLKEETVRRILDAAPPHLYRPLALIDATGCKPGEVVGVCAADLDGEDQAVRFGGRKVPVPELWPSVWGWAREVKTGPVCRNSEGQPWTVDALDGAFKRLCARLGVRREASLRHLRSSYAARLLGEGVAAAEVAARLGVTEKHVRTVYWHCLPLGECRS